MSGKKLSVAALLNKSQAGSASGAAPAFARRAARSAPLTEIVPNPLNTRAIDPESEEMRDLAESLREHGQLEPCAVATRETFLRLYPEHADNIGVAAYVQITGGRRYVAAQRAGLDQLELLVREPGDRAAWISATAAENLARQNFDAIEEARTVELLVKECGGNQAEAARRLSKTPAWVTQRLNLRRLAPEVQAAVSAGTVPLREVRDLHTVPTDQQVAVLSQRRAEREAATTERRTTPRRVRQLTESAAQPATAAVTARGVGEVPTPRNPSVPAAVRQLGATPSAMAATLAAALDADMLQMLVDALRAHLNAHQRL